MRTNSLIALLAMLATLGLGACASKPQATQSGFLSDYAKLQVVDSYKARWVSPELNGYEVFEVSRVEFRTPPQKLSEKERAEVGEFFRAKFVEHLEQRGKTVLEPGAREIASTKVARARFAVTDIAESVWIAKVHPGMRLTGAGTGGAALEAEFVDVKTGEQLAAWVYSGSGRRVDFTAFSTVADVKSAVERWMAEEVGRDWERADVGGNAQE